MSDPERTPSRSKIGSVYLISGFILFLCILFFSLIPRAAFRSLWLSAGLPFDGFFNEVFFKIGHVFSFCVLVVYFLVWRKSWLWTLSASVALAFGLEFLQSYSPGRSPGISEVGLDVLGILLGAMLVALYRIVTSRAVS